MVLAFLGAAGFFAFGSLALLALPVLAAGFSSAGSVLAGSGGGFSTVSATAAIASSDAIGLRKRDWDSNLGLGLEMRRKRD